MPGGQPGELHGERPPRVVRCAARSPQRGAMVGRGTAKANPCADQRGYLQEQINAMTSNRRESHHTFAQPDQQSNRDAR